METNKIDDLLDGMGEISEYCEEEITPSRMSSVLDNLYQKSINGINKPIEKIAEDYLKKNSDVSGAAKAMLNMQVVKCTASGFVTGFGGFSTMPVTTPLNAFSVLYFQMRMIECVAYMGGFDLRDDRVQTFIFACMAGIPISSVLKDFGIRLGKGLTLNAIEKIPEKVLTKINQKVGFKLITKFSEKGLIRLGRIVPVVGAVISGSIDLAETKIIANRAYKMFIEKDFSVCDKKNKNTKLIHDEIDVEAK